MSSTFPKKKWVVLNLQRFWKLNLILSTKKKKERKKNLFGLNPLKANFWVWWFADHFMSDTEPRLEEAAAISFLFLLLLPPLCRLEEPQAEVVG